MTITAEKIVETKTAKPLSKLYELMEKTWAFAVATFDPTDDTMVQFFAQTDDNKLNIYATPWHNDFEKAMVLNLLRDRFKAEGVQRYTLVSEAFFAEYPADAPEDGDSELPPSAHPNRIETLIVLGVDPDAHEIMQYNAIITRDADGNRSLGVRVSLEASATPGGVMTELLGTFAPRSVQ